MASIHSGIQLFSQLFSGLDISGYTIQTRLEEGIMDIFSGIINYLSLFILS